MPMHEWTAETEALARDVLSYTVDRLHLNPVPLDGPRSPAELREAAGNTITPDGLGGPEVLRLFAEVLAPACISIDHPRYLAFIPCAPTHAATLFDLVVGASSIYGGSWLEGAGAVYAENEALAWLASLAGLPVAAGGVFVQGGTLANLSALIAARFAALDGEARAARLAIIASSEAHSSIQSAAHAMDVDVIPAPTDAEGRLSGESVAEALGDEARSPSRRRVFAVVATAGTTNLGVIDDLAGIASVAAGAGLWFHIDGAYGAAALAAASVAGRFRGIELADSLVVDPHKWLFAPFDCAALLYRDPAIARAAHTQHADYLEPLRTGDWSPSDYALHLTRRSRGLPFWFSLAAHGTRAYAESIETTLEVARYAAASVRQRPELELLAEPELTIVGFRRLGWSPGRYHEWSRQLLASWTAFVVPTVHRGEVVARLAIVNPRTTPSDIDMVLDTMAG